MAKEKSRFSSSSIWTEKYRPDNFDDLTIGHENLIKRARAFVTSKNMPHLSFAGPAGCGKTTLALIIVKELYGKNRRENFLELNASDARGIDVVRQQIKSFARVHSLGDVPFKIIFLDESDALTKEAQQALRRTMENYTETCRFILSCNYSSKLIDPIQSRCAVFRFKLIDKKDIDEKIDIIAKGESLKIDEKAKSALYEVSNGDLRRAINLLQASASVDKHITENLVYEIASTVKPTQIKHILENSLDGKFLEAREKLFDLMLKEGLSGIDIIKAISSQLTELKISNEKKLKIIERVAEAEFRLVEGSDEFIQLEALLASFGVIGR